MDRYFDDFSVGECATGGPVVVAPDAVRAFAEAFDPQPFHLDPVAAESSVFAGLTASGWHTAALGMRMFVETGMFVTTGFVGVGVDELRWTKPVRPGDTLHLACEIIEMRRSSSGKRGTIRVALRVSNQHGVVMTQTATLLIPTRSKTRP